GEDERVAVEDVFGNPAICDVPGFVDLENPALIELLEEIAQTQHDHLMRDDEHARSRLAVMEAQRIEERSQSQNDVGPTLAARRAIVELADAAAQLDLLGK